ncbi:CCGSCS motif protein [Photobacterium rosenbergii]|uniref:CCGSCS motif protein n=1 Tax=Photobacterium rosenbergii TaxID=294936 RepID=A0A2T3N8A7_9GAMM|nr:CCGSCS motif protein [Photobacterium rosenbergii]PSW09416.1 CCGSCS motif protein [Photobacterium rosenbergii]
MAISFTKIFKKSDNNTEDKKLVEQPNSVEAQAEKEGSTEQEKTTKKHGEPGFCCGSCS